MRRRENRKRLRFFIVQINSKQIDMNQENIQLNAHNKSEYPPAHKGEQK
jgi:hypothetical protein